MSTEEKLSKLDFKQIGGGSVVTALLLFLLQDRGVEFMNQKYKADNQMVIEKTIANANRISSLEKSVTDLNKKLDQGFDSLRKQISSEVDKIGTLVHTEYKMYWTRNDQDRFSDSINQRVDRLEDRVIKIEDKLNKE